MLIKNNETYFYGGLNRLLKYLNINGRGIKHQVGSNIIATIEYFHKLVENEIIKETNLKEFKNVLYWNGIGKDNENTIKYLNNSNNNINIIKINDYFFPLNLFYHFPYFYFIHFYLYLHWLLSESSDF